MKYGREEYGRKDESSGEIAAFLKLLDRWARKESGNGGERRHPSPLAAGVSAVFFDGKEEQGET
jgi:hypothetical protein